MRTASPSIFSSAVTSTLVPDDQHLAGAVQHLAEQVTSTEPAASEMRTQAMRLPVRVMRSLVATTVPASLTRVTPARGARLDLVARRHASRRSAWA